MTLNDICELIVDCPHSTAKDEGAGYPLIRTPNIGRGRLILDDVHRVSKDVYDKRNARAIPQDNDLILAREAPVGNVAIIKNGEKVCLGQRTVLIRPDRNKVYPDFLAYYILAPQQQYELLGTANGATVAHVNIPVIKALPVELPTIEVQQRVANILKIYDDLIENNQKQIKLLEETAEKIYKEWFINLQYPGYEGEKLIDGLPDGWANVKVTDLLEIKYGKDHKGLEEGGIPVYGSGGIMRKVKRVLYSGESVLIPRKGSLNNILFVEGDFWTIDTMFYSIPRLENVAKYVYLHLRGLDMYSFNIGAVPSMTTKILSGMDIVLPSDSILRQFEEQISPAFARMKCLEMQCETAAEARDRLLPKLMSGEIEV